MTKYRTALIDGLDIFYREAGSRLRWFEKYLK
jgi:hypothetical protein